MVVVSCESLDDWLEKSRPNAATSGTGALAIQSKNENRSLQFKGYVELETCAITELPRR